MQVNHGFMNHSNAKTAAKTAINVLMNRPMTHLRMEE